MAAQAAETKSKEEEAVAAAEAAKEEKKKKVAADKEAAKAAKEAAKAEAEAAKAKAAEAAKEAQGAAAALVGTGKVGDALVAALEGAGDGVTPRAVTAAALAKAADAGNLTGTEWLGDDQYGAALKKLCKGKGSTQKQSGILYACQEAYQKGGFPKTAEANKDGKKESYLEKLFFELYNADLVEEDAFNEWRYADDDDEKDPNFVPGKTDALFQISDFLKWLDEPPEEESGEEDEEEEDELPPAPVAM